MQTDILDALSSLLPSICIWVEEQEAVILRDGLPLAPGEMKDAVLIGVEQPEKVRLMQVGQVPMPRDPMMRAVIAQGGLNYLGADGLSLRYGIYIHSSLWRGRARIVHELAHTAQYERLGGVRQFMQKYLTECITAGYFQSPLEMEAVEWSRQLTG